MCLLGRRRAGIHGIVFTYFFFFKKKSLLNPRFLWQKGLEKLERGSVITENVAPCAMTGGGSGRVSGDGLRLVFNSSFGMGLDQSRAGAATHF